MTLGPGKPSSKSLGKQPIRNTTTTTIHSSSPAYTPSRESSSLNEEVEDQNAPPSVVAARRGRTNKEKRVLPTRARRGGPGAGMGNNEVDLNILDLLRRKGESEPLIPRRTVFILTTDSKCVPSASTSDIGLNRCANERFFDRPEVIKAFKEQQVIQIPEFIEVPEHDMVSSKLRVRSGGMIEDISNESYEKRHLKHEKQEKRERLQEREQLVYEHYRVKARIEELRNMDPNAFLALSGDAFKTSGTFAEEEAELVTTSSPGASGTISEGERRQQIMMKAAETLEARYRALLPDKRPPKKDKVTEPSIIVSAELSIVIGDGDNADDVVIASEEDAAVATTSRKTKSSKRKANKPHDRPPTAPPSTLPYRTGREGQQPSDEHQQQADSITVIAQRHPPYPKRSNQPRSSFASRHDEVLGTISRLDNLQNRPRNSAQNHVNGDRPPPYDETTKAPEPAMMEIDHPIIPYEAVGPGIIDIRISLEDVSKGQEHPPPKRQRLRIENMKQIEEQRHIRIDGLPELSPTAAFPTHEFLPQLKDPALGSSTPDSDTAVHSEQMSLTAQFDNITLTARDESVSQPSKRKVGRPRKQRPPPDADWQQTPATHAPDNRKTPAVPKKRATTTPVRRQTTPIPEPVLVEKPVTDELSRTPLDFYEIVTGPGRRPFIPCIISASKHNTDQGRKSRRSVKAFGADVPSFDEREADFEVPSEIIEQIEDTRDGPGKDDGRISVDDPHRNIIVVQDTSAGDLQPLS